jgi:hypothetical protein
MSHRRNRLDFRGFPDLDRPVSHLAHRHDARIRKISFPKSQPNARIRVHNSGRETL